MTFECVSKESDSIWGKISNTQKQQVPRVCLAGIRKNEELPAKWEKASGKCREALIGYHRGLDSLPQIDFRYTNIK